MEDSGRESHVKPSMLCKSLGVGLLSVIIRLRLASIDGKDFTVARVVGVFISIAKKTYPI